MTIGNISYIRLPSLNGSQIVKVYIRGFTVASTGVRVLVGLECGEEFWVNRDELAGQ